MIKDFYDYLQVKKDYVVTNLEKELLQENIDKLKELAKKDLEELQKEAPKSSPNLTENKIEYGFNLYQDLEEVNIE